MISRLREGSVVVVYPDLQQHSSIKREIGTEVHQTSPRPREKAMGGGFLIGKPSANDGKR